jgi:hypothetical protein
VELIKKLWGIAWDLWEHRSDILREQQNVLSHALLCALDRNVNEAYARLKQILLPKHDRHLTSISIA